MFFSLAWQRLCLQRPTLPLWRHCLPFLLLRSSFLQICHFPNSLRDNRTSIAYILSAADVFAFLFCQQKSPDIPNFSRTLQNDKPSSSSRTLHALPPLHPASISTRACTYLSSTRKGRIVPFLLHGSLPTPVIISMERCPRTYPSRRPLSTASVPSIPA